MQEKANVIVQAILIISSIFILVAAFVILYLLYFNRRKAKLIEEKAALRVEFNKQLQLAQVEVQEITYSTMSKELHDNIGQLLSTAKMLLGFTARTLADPPDSLRTAEATVAQAISELRSLSKSLDKEWLEQFSFTDNLKTEITRINSGNNISAEFGQNDSIQLKSDEQIILFRIVQEAMQNAIKHARPKTIKIDVAQQESNLLINIYDDGTGFSATASNGMGLKNMEHRTHLLGGTINWNSAPHGGTIINIILPIKKTPA